MPDYYKSQPEHFKNIRNRIDMKSAGGLRKRLELDVRLLK